MRRLYEMVGFLIGLVAAALNNTNKTGKYHSFANCKRMVFTLIGGAMAATKTTKIEILEAKDSAGTGAQLIDNASAIVTANTNVRVASIALAAADATDKVTINGVIFTMAAGTTVSDREFANAAGLVLCINDADYGVPGVKASANETTVTVEPADSGALEDDTTITLAKTEVAGTITLATVEAILFVEIDSQFLSEDYTHVAAKVTTTADTVVAVGVNAYDARYTPEQSAVSAYAVV